MGRVYVPRFPTTGVLYGIVRTHLTDFLATVDARTDGTGLPSFVVAEFRKFLRCGLLAHGFARVRCGACGFERMLPFSCRAAASVRAAAGGGWPSAPRTWWITCCRPTCPCGSGSCPCRTGSATGSRTTIGSAGRCSVCSCGPCAWRIGSLNLHVHFHTLVLDGVFVEAADGTLQFHPAAAPTDADVEWVVARVRRRLERRGIVGCATTEADTDPLADESAALAGLTQAAVLGRAALGRRAGRGRCESVATPTRRGATDTSRSTPRPRGSTSTRPST
jgi:hypothetical protein